MRSEMPDTGYATAGASVPTPRRALPCAASRVPHPGFRGERP